MKVFCNIRRWVHLLGCVMCGCGTWLLEGCYHTSVFTIWRHMQYLRTCHHCHWKFAGLGSYSHPFRPVLNGINWNSYVGWPHANVTTGLTLMWLHLLGCIASCVALAHGCLKHGAYLCLYICIHHGDRINTWGTCNPCSLKALAIHSLSCVAFWIFST